MAGKLFVTGASGFIGGFFVPEAVRSGYEVVAMTRSENTARRIRALGAQVVVGDLSDPGPWQEALAGCEYAVHMAQPDTYGARVTRERAVDYGHRRKRADANLLESMDVAKLKKVVFVCGTSYYGHQGVEMQREVNPPNPKGWGPYIGPAIEMLSDYVERGWPIVQAFPGWVYGPGSWFEEYQLVPLSKKRPVVRLGGRPQVASPVHVLDCARAFLHLLDHGETGLRYFIVDDMAVPSTRMVEIASEAMGVQGRILPLPKWMCLMAVGPIITESMMCDFRLSNDRLKASGFEFIYPTIDTGIPDVVRRWRSP